MRRSLLVVVGLVLIVVAGLAFTLPSILKTRSIKEALTSYISKQPAKKTDVWGDLGSGTYGGVLVAANRFGLLIWGEGWPRWYWYASGDSALSFFDICQGISQEGTSTRKQVGRQVFFNVPSWSEKIRPGDYVFVSKNNNVRGAFKEVWGYNAWYFSDKKTMESQCRK